MPSEHRKWKWERTLATYERLGFEPLEPTPENIRTARRIIQENLPIHHVFDTGVGRIASRILKTDRREVIDRLRMMIELQKLNREWREDDEREEEFTT